MPDNFAMSAWLVETMVDRLGYESPLGPKTGYFLQLLAAIGWSSLPALPLKRPGDVLLEGRCEAQETEDFVMSSHDRLTLQHF